MQWFNWILRGGRKEALPDFFVEARWLREMYPTEEQARRAIADVCEAGPLAESELRHMTGRAIEAYFRVLVDCLELHGAGWIRRNPETVRHLMARGQAPRFETSGAGLDTRDRPAAHSSSRTAVIATHVRSETSQTTPSRVTSGA